MIGRVTTLLVLVVSLYASSSAAAQVSPAVSAPSKHEAPSTKHQAPSIAPSTKHDAPSTFLTGTIIDPQTRAGIEGVRVWLTPGDREATTDNTGRFVLAEVPAGRYHLVARLDGYQAFGYAQDVIVPDEGEPAPLVVEYALAMATEVRARADDAAVRPPAGALASPMSGRAIAASPGGLEDVFRVFQSQPGVAASKDDRNDLLVRGGGAIENAVRVDGFDVPNPTHFGAQGGMGGGLSMVAPWIIDRAVLQAGGFPVEFGERASSVLDLSLKGAEGVRVHGMGGASVGGAMAEADGPLGRGAGSWLVTARRSFLELAFERGADRAVPHYADALARVDYALTPRHRLEVLAIAGRDEVTTDGTSDPLDDRQGMTFGGVSLRSRWSAATTTGVFVSYGRMAIDARMGDNALNKGYDRGHEIEWRARGEVRHAFGRVEASAGASVRQTGVQYDLFSFAFRNEYGLIVPALRSAFAGTFTDLGAYADARIPITARLVATPGVRVDRAGPSGQVSASPRLNVEFHATHALRFTGAVGVYRQAIPLIWIASLPANAALEPVRSVQALAGVSMSLPRGLQAGIEGFEKRYEGYPVDPAEPWQVLVSAAADFESPFVGRLMPVGKLRARGLDAHVGRRFGEHVELGAAYSLWHVTQAAMDEVWRPSTYDIRHQARLSATWEVPGVWRAGAELRLASGRPYTPFDIKASLKAGWGRYDRTEINEYSYPTYQRLDARIERMFTVNRTRLVVYGEVDNLYNRNNMYLYNWSSSLKAPQPVYQWGLMPVGGVRWEF